MKMSTRAIPSLLLGASIAATGVLGAGCVDLAPREVTPIRYFSADVPTGSALGSDPGPSGSPPNSLLRLGHVRSAEHLGDRIVWRGGDVELGFHEDLRWSEPPVAYLDRRLRRALIDGGGGLPRSDQALEVHATLLALEELRVGPHEGRATVLVELRDSRGRVELVREFEARAAVEGDDGAAIARGLDAALRAVVAEAAAAVLERAERVARRP